MTATDIAGRATVFAILDDVGEASAEVRYVDWQREAARRFAMQPWCVETLRMRGVDELPGGVAKGRFYPRFLTLAVIDAASAPRDEDMRTLAGWPSPSASWSMLAASFVERNPGQRRGRFLSEASPRTIFLIGQDVFPDKDAAYNHWFDVDDGSRDPPISHYDERLSHPGFMRGTRMRNAGNGAPQASARTALPNYLTLYEVAAPSALQSREYTTAPQNKRSAGGGGMFDLLIRHTFVELPA